MIKVLVELIAHFAIFLESADETMIPLETAVQQQEEMAFRLQRLTPEERAEFVRLLALVAEEESSPERRDILKRLPQEIGLA